MVCHGYGTVMLIIVDCVAIEPKLYEETRSKNYVVYLALLASHL